MPSRSSGNPRNSNGHARRELRRRVGAMGLPCHICGGPIDYSLPAGHPMAYELDELRPVSRWREFGYPSAAAAALDPGNVAPSHRSCNQRRGNKMPSEQARLARLAPIARSRDWLGQGE